MRRSEILRQSNSPAFLVSNLINIRYLTGVDLSAGLLLITKQKMRLFVDSRYSEVASKKVGTTIDVCSIHMLDRVMSRVRICGFEANSTTVERLKQWKRRFKNTKFVQKTGVVEQLRRQKNPDEMKKFRKAQSITRLLMAAVPDLLEEGTTEQQIAWELESLARMHGAEGLSFEPIVAFGTHTSRPHHRPTSRRFVLGQLVQIDIGARYRGYCADQSEVFFTGVVTALQKKAFEALSEAKKAAKERVKVGVSNHELDIIARQVLKTYDLEQYFTHGLGHGVGLEVHEGISLSQKAPKQKLLEHEIVTIEPGVYLPGRFGMRLEEEVIVRS